MVALFALVAPALVLIIAVLLGVLFSFAPVKTRTRKPIPVSAFGAIFGVVALLVVFMFNNLLNGTVYSIGLFASFAGVFSSINIPMIMYNSSLVAAIVLIATVEVGLASGFGAAFAIQGRKEKAPAQQTAVSEEQPTEIGKISSQVKPSIASAIASLDDDNTASREEGLLRDEQSMMELFLYGKVTQITPTVNPEKPEGYFYEGIPQLDWDTKHSTHVLEALVRKGYLNSELVDKLIICQTCSSGNVRIVKSCPECGSLRLHKEGLIEHFSCGAVERQSMFESRNCDLVCPKCKAKLQLIGSDYRILPPAYKCMGCNTLHSEPKLLIKCIDCTSTAELDDEPEILLYKYTANPQMPTRELQRIKPIDNVTQYFKNLGYTIVAPAFVSGKSGTQHLFDMLILGRVGWIETQQHEVNSASQRSSNGNTAVEVLISGKAINVGEVTRIYGKISDIDTDFILFAVPGLTANARNYAKAYGLKVSEGRNIEEALANSKIPKIGDGAKSVGVLPQSANPLSIPPDPED
ncbi:hypothetical protein GX563_09380 [Candidatus Bathyarchaeota archaeon]|nr:hypothetical protein [Candidatus Bathyarchaeota archaeon]